MHLFKALIFVFSVHLLDVRALECYNYLRTMTDNSSQPDTVSETCADLHLCVVILEVHALIKNNPQLNQTIANAVASKKADQGALDQDMNLNLKSSLAFQGCLRDECRHSKGMRTVCEMDTMQSNGVMLCCCNSGLGCNRLDNIVIPHEMLVQINSQRTENNSSMNTMSGLGYILLFTLVPATVLGVIAIITYLLTKCKYDKITHIIGRGTNDVSNPSRLSCPISSKDPKFAEAEMITTAAVVSNENQQFLRSLDLSVCPVIGQGKFGQVHKLERSFMGEDEVAIKVFYVSDRPSWLKEVEIYSLPPVQTHPNILKFLAADDQGPEGGGCWLVTEYHQRGSVHDYLKVNNPVSPQALLRIAESFFCGLAFLHDGFPSCSVATSSSGGGGSGGIRIAHRDIKSRNILLKKDLTCCIADFGLAMELRPDQEIGCAHSQVGTRRYMAPEVLEGAIIFTAEAFLRIDIYAASLVLWELLNCCTVNETTTYKVPFEVELGPTPAAEQINVFVAENRMRPVIPVNCKRSKMLSVICETVEECWDQDCEARLSAVCVQQRLLRLQAEFNNTEHHTSSQDDLNAEYIPELDPTSELHRRLVATDQTTTSNNAPYASQPPQPQMTTAKVQPQLEQVSASYV
ncbi:TGF-beta receptor type-2-like [Convolutriloba macropyga]|uniref:TGF-beta receptor type-2-like n=1 Tax=Convolutriloba macropyga TaxID=536237 RepID=UPI003F520743